MEWRYQYCSLYLLSVAIQDQSNSRPLVWVLLRDQARDSPSGCMKSVTGDIIRKHLLGYLRYRLLLTLTFFFFFCKRKSALTIAGGMAFHNQILVCCGRLSRSAVEIRKLVEHQGGKVAFSVAKNEVCLIAEEAH